MEDFLFLTQECSDAYFNLASEEYLLTKKNENFIYLWRNAPSVIIGINQNAFEEVNLDYTQKNGIKVVRRLTGGGAVYHDLYNINYTVIAPYDENVNNYKKFTAPVIEYLSTLGVKAEFSGRNDITVDGKKISGNAQTIKDGRIMHHGTLLFHTDMDALSNALKPNKLKTESKGIKSIRARVTNIYECLPKKMTAEEFFSRLCEFFKKSSAEYRLTENDICEIEKLRDEKYSRYEWNIGRSPKGKNRAEGRFSFGTLAISFDTEKGNMQNVAITGDFFSLKPIGELITKLNGIKFTREEVENVFSFASEYIVGADGKEIADMLFGE